MAQAWGWSESEKGGMTPATEGGGCKSLRYKTFEEYFHNRYSAKTM